MILPLVAHTVTAPSFVPGSKTLLRCLKRINAQVVGSSTANPATRDDMCIRIRNHTEAMMASYAPNLQPCG